MPGPIYHELYRFYSYRVGDPSIQTPYVDRKSVSIDGVTRYYFVCLVCVAPLLYDANTFKVHRNAYSSAYKLNFYRNWDSGSGTYSDLVYTYDSPNSFYFDGTDNIYIYWIQPRTGMPNKGDLIASGTHPYDDPMEAFYIEIVETHDEAKPYTGNVAYPSDPDEGDQVFTGLDEYGYEDLAIRLIHQNQDLVTCDVPARSEKIVSYGSEVKGPYHYSFWYLRMENFGALPTLATNWTIPFKSRKSGFYGSVKKYPWIKWELKTLTASVISTRFTFTASTGGVSGFAHGFNEDSDAHVVYTTGLGEIPGWTGILAEYYCETVTVSTLSTYGSCYVLRDHTNWKKWDGSNWIDASSGDAIVNPYVSDTYTVHGINRTRTSNQITMSSTLT